MSFTYYFEQFIFAYFELFKRNRCTFRGGNSVNNVYIPSKKGASYKIIQNWLAFLGPYRETFAVALYYLLKCIIYLYRPQIEVFVGYVRAFSG